MPFFIFFFFLICLTKFLECVNVYPHWLDFAIRTGDLSKSGGNDASPMPSILAYDDFDEVSSIERESELRLEKVGFFPDFFSYILSHFN